MKHARHAAVGAISARHGGYFGGGLALEGAAPEACAAFRWSLSFGLGPLGAVEVRELMNDLDEACPALICNVVALQTCLLLGAVVSPAERQLCSWAIKLNMSTS